MRTTGIVQVGLRVGVVCVGGFWAAPSWAQQTPSSDMLGAQKVLEVIAQAGALTNAVSSPKASSAIRTQYTNDLARFKIARVGMKPEQAATEWLSLLDRLGKLPDDTPDSQSTYSSYRDERGILSFDDVVEAIPEPSAWGALAAAVEKRPPQGANDPMFETLLRLFTDYLTGATDKLEKDLAVYESQIVNLDGYERQYAQRALQDIRKYIERSRQGDTPDGLVRQLEKALESQKVAKRGKITLMVPDLIPLIGEERTEKLLVQALETPGVKIRIAYGEATMAMARRLCLERIDNLSQPQWALVNSPDAVTLYEKMAKKFSLPQVDQDKAVESEFVESDDVSDGDRSGEDYARSYYLIGLLAQNRMQEALSFVAGMKADKRDKFLYSLHLSWEIAENAVPSAVLFDFCGSLVKTDDNKSFWRTYITLAVQMGRTSEMLDLFSAEAARTDLSFSKHLDALERLIAGNLAADRVEEAVRVVQKIMNLDVSKKTTAEKVAFESSRLEQSSRLAQLGKLLGKPEWVAEGIRVFEESVDKAADGTSGRGSYEIESRVREFYQVLLDSHQYAKAESLLVKVIAKKIKTSTSARDYYSEPEPPMEELVMLAQVYYQAGRYQDILDLLEKAPWWGVKDLMDVYENYSYEGTALPIMAAQGLQSAGRTAEAIKILKTSIELSPGDDDAYALLEKIEKDDWIPWLDSLYQRDRFEERPLIWKARLLQKAGKLDEAEKTILEALHVDPTDGETKSGNRVRAYAVMSEIKAAKGKQDDAKFFADVVEAVRIAEHGDELTEAGLIAQSIAEYEKAQAHFADAYCVQWRLAKRFDELGKTEEAEKHYRIAFERMPEQFGQVASFCFGCEGAFESKHSQSAAEKVLLGLEKAGPKRPQVFYLLGQLRGAQDRYSEAYAYYRKAVEMDPDYLDAWDQIQSMADRIFLPQAERDRISFALLRIDPSGLHSCVDFEEIHDLPMLWTVLQSMPRQKVVLPERLLPLVASAARIEEQKKDKSSEFEQYRSYIRDSRDTVHTIPEPSEALVKNKFIQTIIELMSQRAKNSSSVPDDVVLD